MADTLKLIDKSVKLTCPICGCDYPYSLVNIMGFSLDGTGSTEALGVAPVTSPPYDALTEVKREQTEEQMEKELKQPHTYIFTCPKDQKQLQVTLYLKDGEVKPLDIETVSPDNAALYVTGQQIQTNSLSVASSFCSAMVGVSTGSVAVYTGLLALVIPKSSTLLWPADLWSLIPAAGFIAAAILFAWGAFPHQGTMRLSYPTSIENFRDDAIAKRIWLTRVGFCVLCVALLAAFIFIAWIAGSPASVSPVASPTGTPTVTPIP